MKFAPPLDAYPLDSSFSSLHFTLCRRGVLDLPRFGVLDLLADLRFLGDFDLDFIDLSGVPDLLFVVVLDLVPSCVLDLDFLDLSGILDL